MTVANTIVKTKKAIIFDMDGTIVNNTSYHNRARLLFLERHKIQYQPSEENNILKLSTKEIVRRYFGTNLTSKEIKTLDDEKQLIYRTIYGENIREVKGFKNLLDEAKSKGVKIALSTMGGHENIDLVLNSLKVKSYFDVIISGDEIPKGKPHPDIYLKTLAQLNLNPEEAIVFEDTQSGVTAALQANIPVIGVCTSLSTSEFRSLGVHRSIDNYTDLHNIYNIPA